jgi:hypothetical protein
LLSADVEAVLAFGAAHGAVTVTVTVLAAAAAAAAGAAAGVAGVAGVPLVKAAAAAEPEKNAEPEKGNAEKADAPCCYVCFDDSSDGLFQLDSCAHFAHRDCLQGQIDAG